MSERHVTFDMICRAVCACSGLTRAELMSEDRRADWARARFSAWWLASKMTTLSMGAIARLSGDRDHTTVLAGVSRAEQLRASAPEFRAATDALLETLRALEQAGMLRLAETIDPVAAARRVLNAPEREAVRVSTFEIIAMSQLIVALHGPTDEPTPELELNHAHAAA
jgi:hypothetical protein